MIFNEIMTRFYSSEIDKNGIVKLYSERVTSSDLANSFLSAFTNKDLVLLENSFFVGFTLNIISNKHQEILLKLLGENWHREHEDITGLFQRNFNDNTENIFSLLKAINKIPEYLNEDDFKYPYIRKLIYSIGAQPEPNNIEELEKLANETNDKQIRELALHQIKKRQELGRWEASKNAQ
jgi:hypothetical protein